ncbi:hypothetical protein CDL12_14678 [Handroanthus impetiginosus]|uniref:Bifunctional inhibitor/plant lipid transfer protein/seed storage helical domain-containing protein n=1 Tax=Handroanthus impetiginosus TaxID=429701 RepID=A0A2G9H5D2_9LAMI|nr:hypothetical protein CDL12_14678 [Handroanthus impetiginosus]
MAFSSTITAFLTVALLVAAANLVEGQSDCIAKLVPCAEYLNSTNPAPTCCNAIREVVSAPNELECLCRIYRNPRSVGSINMTQALMLPRHCNISSDVSTCKAVPGGGNNGNAAGRISWTGMPAFLLVSALTLLY